MFNQQQNSFKLLTYWHRNNFKKNWKIRLFHIKIILNHNSVKLFEKNFEKNHRQTTVIFETDLKYVWFWSNRWTKKSISNWRDIKFDTWYLTDFKTEINNVVFIFERQKSIWSCFNKSIINYFDQAKFIYTVKKLNQ